MLSPSLSLSLARARARAWLLYAASMRVRNRTPSLPLSSPSSSLYSSHRGKEEGLNDIDSAVIASFILLKHATRKVMREWRAKVARREKSLRRSQEEVQQGQQMGGERDTHHARAILLASSCLPPSNVDEGGGEVESGNGL